MNVGMACAKHHQMFHEKRKKVSELPGVAEQSRQPGVLPIVAGASVEVTLDCRVPSANRQSQFSDNDMQKSSLNKCSF
jgi:hypothetical protein